MSTAPGRGGRDELSRSLRELREAAGLTQVPAAAAAGISQAGLSRIERGGLLPAPETVEALARVYGADPDTTTRLVELATAIRPEYLDSRIIMQRGINHFQQRLGKVEQSSALVRAYQPNIILGMLQTAAYAEVVFTSRGRTAPQTADGVASRLARQAALTEPGRDWVLIQTEGALDWCVRDATLMAEQIDHIIEVTRLPNVRFGLIIRRTPTTILAPHGFHIFDARAVQVGIKTAVALIDNAEDIATYETLFSELERMAVFGDDARAELSRIADEYRRAPDFPVNEEIRPQRRFEPVQGHHNPRT
ncbi:MAG TPA: helix-turn-helix transcriptional regulator [Pseudonocardiaceae bacterium]|nr:helix-turn-helix transcriptional regulator [Pseudonocardiaceae bacterium]